MLSSTCAFKGRVVGKRPDRAGALQGSAGVFALSYQGSVELNQQALVQIPGTTVHHLAQGHLQVIGPGHSGDVQVHRQVVMQMYIQTCKKHRSCQS